MDFRPLLARFMRVMALTFGVFIIVGLIGKPTVHAEEFTIVVGHTGPPALSTYHAV